MGTATRGIDLDAVRARLDKLKKSKKNSNLTWKPTDKEQTIRIVPYKLQPDNPFIELYFHYNFNGKTYLSPVSFGKPDPVMEVAQGLKNTGNKEDWIQGKQLEPKLRTFAPIIVRGQEHEGVKFWGFGKTIYEELLSNIADPDCGDITDPASGYDIVVYTVKEEGKKFNTPKMRIKRNSSPVTNDRAILQKIVEEQPDINELYEEKTYEELAEALELYLNPEEVVETPTTDTPDESPTESPAESTETDTKPASETPEKLAPETIANPEDVKAMFDDIFKDKPKDK